MTTRYFQDPVLDSPNVIGGLSLASFDAPSGALTVTQATPSVIYFNPGQAGEKLILPTASENVGKLLIVKNQHSSRNMQARNTADTANVGGTIAARATAMFHCDGDQWNALFESATV